MLRKNLFPILILMVFVTLLASSAFAENSPYSRNTEVYYQADLKQGDIKNVVADAFKKIQSIEILQPYLSKFSELGGISLEKDVFSWMGSRVQFGIVGGDKYSVLNVAFKEMKAYNTAKGQLSAQVNKMRSIRDAIEMYREEHRKLPPNLKSLEKTFINPNILVPVRGKSFTYRKLSEDRYSIISPKDKFKDLGLTGEQPCYDSQDDFSGTYPAIKDKFNVRNMLLTFDITDSTQAREAFLRLEKFFDKASGNDQCSFRNMVWEKYIIRVGKHFSYTFYDRMVLISDNPGTLKAAIESMKRPDKNIFTNSLFRKSQKEWPQSTGSVEMIFIDLNKINLASLLDKKSENKGFYSLVKGLDYILYYYAKTSEGLEGDMVLSFSDQNKSSIIRRYLNTPEYSGNNMENLPAGIPLAVTYNMGELWNILSVLKQDYKKVSFVVEKLEDKFKMTTGMDMQKDFLSSTSGEISVTYYMRDLFISTFISAFRQYRTPAEDSDDDDKDPKKIIKHAVLMKGVPMTIFLGIKDKAKIEEIMESLKTRDEFKKTYYNDVAIYSSPKMTFCLAGDMLMVHTFPSDTKVKQYIDILTQKRDRMGETTNYREFKKGIKGRTIIITYQDSRWAASIAKGILLFFLPEFEDYADRIGQFKESWSSFSISPNGIQMHFQAFRGK